MLAKFHTSAHPHRGDNTVLRLAALAFAVVCCSFIAPAAAQEQNKPPEGFVALFNGTDLSGWYGLGHFDPRSCGP